MKTTNSKPIIHTILIIGILLQILNWFLHFGNLSKTSLLICIYLTIIGIVSLVAIWSYYFMKLRDNLANQGITDKDVWLFFGKSIIRSKDRYKHINKTKLN